MEKIIFNLKVTRSQRAILKKLLREAKKATRYTYPEIIIMSLSKKEGEK